jgi:crotonobetainyl-CoA:carnitine CoA-transferase CaiB-like acyl-CoA transferase
MEDRGGTRPKPLEGIRVIDLSQVFAMPYTAGLLGDLGAEVIKVEAPHRMDQTRGYSALPENTAGADPWNHTGTFATLNRNKRSLVMDLGSERARKLFLKLVSKTDIVIENFTPRVMRGWGLHYESLREVRPDLIMLSNTGYGSTGPWSQYPSQGTVIEATIGISAYTGYRGGPPSKVGQSYPDFLATWIGLYSVLAALHYRERSGRGQWIDLGMYQLGASLVPQPILQYQVDGSTPERTGNEHEEFVPYNLYQALGRDEWVAICVTSDEQWRQLTEIMGSPGLAGDPRYASARMRRKHRKEVDAVVREWTLRQDARECAAVLQNAGIAAGAVLNSRDLLLDPHLKHRGFFEYVDHPEPVGRRPIMGRPYRITPARVSVEKSAPHLGQDNLYVLKDLLGLEQSEVDELYRDGVVAEEPIEPRRAAPINTETGLRAGTLRAVDPDYRARLGI